MERGSLVKDDRCALVSQISSANVKNYAVKHMNRKGKQSRLNYASVKCNVGEPILNKIDGRYNASGQRTSCREGIAWSFDFIIIVYPQTNSCTSDMLRAIPSGQTRCFLINM